MSRLPEIVKASADPAANNEIVFVADEDMIVHSLQVSLVTDANVSNRTVAIVADDGTNIFFEVSSVNSQAASLTWMYVAAEGLPVLKTGLPLMMLPLPTLGLRLRKGDRLLTSTSGKQAGDDYGVMRLQVERI